MKRLFLMALVAMLSTVGANARGFEWGIKGGANIAWQKGDNSLLDYINEALHVIVPDMEEDFVRTRARTDFYAGLFAEWTFNHRFGLQGELLYSQMGSKYKLGDYTFTAKVNYALVPVLLKLYMFENFSVDLGPQFGALISTGDEGGRGDMGYMGIDAFFVAGLTYKFANYFDVSARATFGLLNVHWPKTKKPFDLGRHGL